MAAAATATPVLGALAGSMLLAWRYGRVGRVGLSLVVAVSIAGIAIGSVISARYEQETTSPAYVQPGLTLPTKGALPASVAYRVAGGTQEFLPTISHNIVTGYGPELPPSAGLARYRAARRDAAPEGWPAAAGDLRISELVTVLRKLAAEAGRPGVDLVSGRTTEALVVILVPMLVVDNYFIDPGLAELWWIPSVLPVPCRSTSLTPDLVLSSSTSPRTGRPRMEQVGLPGQ